MGLVLKGLHLSKCRVYLDDIIVVGNDFYDHLAHLKKFFLDLGLKCNSSKCHFFQRQVSFLGHLISGKRA